MNLNIHKSEPSLLICGARGTKSVSGDSYKIFGSNTSCYAVKDGDHGIITDCGTGLPKALHYLKDCTHIDILLTHLHFDHIAGFLGSPVFAGEEKKVRIIGHSEYDSIGKIFEHIYAPPFWPVPVATLGCTFADINPGDKFKLSDGAEIETMAGNHPNGSVMYNIKINHKKISMIFDYEYDGDSRALSDFVSNADLLIFDGTFDKNEFKKYIGWGHSAWHHGIALAKEASVKKLLITHHSPLKDDSQLLSLEKLAQEELSICEFAKEGKEYQL